jgi:hypothetical protein
MLGYPNNEFAKGHYPSILWDLSILSMFGKRPLANLLKGYPNIGFRILSYT